MSVLWKRLRPYRAAFFLLTLCAAVNVLLTLLVPVLVGKAVDHVADGAFSSLPPVLLSLALAAGGAALFAWFVNLIGNAVSLRAVRDIRSEAARKLNRLPLSALDRRPTGELLSRILSDADVLADGLLMGFPKLFTGAMTILGTLVFMLTLSPLIALLVLLVTPLSLLVAKFISRRTYDLFRKQAECKAAQTVLLDETVGGHFTVKAFSLETRQQERFAAANEAYRVAGLKATFFSSLTNPCTRFVNSLVYAVVALAGGMLCIVNPTFSVGTLTAFLSYANQYTKPFNEISGVLTELQNAVACATRLFAFLDEPEETPDPAAELSTPHGDVTFSDVCFSYTPDRKLIEHLNITAAAGQRVAIVGPTGCGKTTLINLLMRFYDPDRGEIAVDGTAVTSVSRESLRRQFGMVLQETWLKSGTVKENIAIGKENATDDEIVAAAKAAHADAFIRRLPQGYDTVLKDGGSLSQGQKQLLCISRLFLCPPPLLILDEATSSIDTRTERQIQDAFMKLMKGRTSFIVAHRLSTIVNADLILVMKDGNVIEQGTHETLLSRDGFYADLWRARTHA